MATFNVTIDATKVAADLTDFPVFIDLSLMPAAFWSAVSAGGGDIRCFKNDGTTELAREVVSCDTVGEAGELHVKYSGTLSSSVDTVIKVVVDGVSSDYAVTDTYGAEAVWADYLAVFHFEDYNSGTIVDSAGNNDGTANGMSAGDIVAGGIGNAFIGDQSNNHITLPTGDFVGISSYTVTALARRTSASAHGWIGGIYQSGGAYRKLYWAVPGGSGQTAFYGRKNAVESYQAAVTTAPTQNAWQHMAWRDNNAGRDWFLDGGNEYTDSIANLAPSARSSEDEVGVGGAKYAGTLNSMGDQPDISEFRITATVLTDSWISSESENLGSPATFYSVEEEAGGGGSEYTLTADTTSFAVSGQATGLAVNRRLQASSASFALPGQATGLFATRLLTAETAGFTVTDEDAGLFRRFLLDAEAGDFTLTGTVVGFGRHYVLTAGTGEFVLSGYQAGLSTEAQLVAATASFAMTGNEASLRVSRLQSASGASYELSGSDAALLVSRSLAAAPSSFAVTGDDADLLRSFSLTAEPASFLWTGNDAGLLLSRLLITDTGSFALTGNDAEFVQTLATRPYCPAPSPYGGIPSPYTDLPPRAC